MNPEKKRKISSSVRAAVHSKRTGTPSAVADLFNDKAFCRLLADKESLNEAFYSAARAHDLEAMRIVQETARDKVGLTTYHEGEGVIFAALSNGGAEEYGVDPVTTKAVDHVIECSMASVNEPASLEHTGQSIPGNHRPGTFRPIHIAAACGNAKLAERLLLAKASPDGTGGDTSSVGQDITPLALAVLHKSAAVAIVLLKAGASPNSRMTVSSGKEGAAATPLHSTPTEIALAECLDETYRDCLRFGGHFNSDTVDVKTPTRNPISSVPALRIWLYSVAARATHNLHQRGALEIWNEGKKKPAAKPSRGALARLASSFSAAFKPKAKKIDGPSSDQLRESDPRFRELRLFEAIAKGNPAMLTREIELIEPFADNEALSGTWGLNPVLLSTVMLCAGQSVSSFESSCDPDLALWGGNLPGRESCLSVILEHSRTDTRLGRHFKDSLRKSHPALGGFGPAHVAAAFSQSLALQSLLDYGCPPMGDPLFNCSGALAVAVRCGDEQTIGTLLSNPEALSWEASSPWERCALRQALAQAIHDKPSNPESSGPAIATRMILQAGAFNPAVIPKARETALSRGADWAVPLLEAAEIMASCEATANGSDANPRVPSASI